MQREKTCLPTPSTSYLRTAPWADGSSWSKVIGPLKAAGLTVLAALLLAPLFAIMPPGQPRRWRNIRNLLLRPLIDQTWVR